MDHTILLVEDAEMIRLMITSMLEDEGYRVIQAENGQEALDQLYRTIPDLIVSDIVMPVMDGYQLYNEVHNHERLRQIPFIFMTAAKTSKEDIRHGKAMGVDDYIVKDDDLDELIAAINGKLQRMNELRQLREKEIDDFSIHILNFLAQKFHTILPTLDGLTYHINDPSYNISREELSHTFHLLLTRTREIDELFEKFKLFTWLNKYLDSKVFEEQQIIILLSDLLDHIQRKWNDRLNLRLKLPDSPVYLRGKKEYLIRMFNELLDNARKSLRNPNHVVEIRVSKTDMCIHLELQDAGCGIAPEHLPHIFDKFYQGDTKGPFPYGSGLGLALVKQIVELHRGEILAESQLHEGTLIRIHLPEFIYQG